MYSSKCCSYRYQYQVVCCISRFIFICRSAGYFIKSASNHGFSRHYHSFFVRNVSFWYMHCLICSISLDQTGRGETVAFPPVWWWIKKLRCQLVHTVSFNGVCLHNRNDVKHMKFTRHLSGKAVFWNKHRRKKQEAGCPLYIEYSWQNERGEC